MKKYPDNIESLGPQAAETAKAKIDAYPKFMYATDKNGGVSIFSLDAQTLAVLPQLKYQPVIESYYNAKVEVAKKQTPEGGLEAECIYASPEVVEDMLTIPASYNKTMQAAPDFKTIKAINCTIKECYGKNFIFGEFNGIKYIETTLAVYDQNKDFKGLVWLMHGR